MPQLSGEQRRAAGPGYQLQNKGAWKCDMPGCDPRWRRAPDPVTALEVHHRLHHQQEEPHDRRP